LDVPGWAEIHHVSEVQKSGFVWSLDKMLTTVFSASIAHRTYLLWGTTGKMVELKKQNRKRVFKKSPHGLFKKL